MNAQYPMVMKDFRDPPTKKDFTPYLKQLENRMYNSLLATPGEYVRKDWLASKSKTEARILRGTLKRKPNSGDVRVRFKVITVPLSEEFDPLK